MGARVYTDLPLELYNIENKNQSEKQFKEKF